MQHDNHSALLQQLKSLSTYSAIFFTEDGLIVDEQAHRFTLPVFPTVDILKLTIKSFHLDQSLLIIKCHCPVLTKDNPFAGYALQGIRALLGLADAASQLQIIRATHWMNWDNQSQFCGKCANPLVTRFDSNQKDCAHCGSIFFPRFSPAVMVLIYRENEILLARSPHFMPGIYSAIAGFVDVGETAEMAVHREVKEELGITISQLDYFSSQTWPFPDSFMIAFKAQYLSGELVVDSHELEDARWFSHANLPKLPNNASIARKLIDSHIIK